MRLFLLVLCLTWTAPTWGQSYAGNPEAVDSLEALIPTIKEDSARLQLFYELTVSFNNVNPQKAIQYGDSVVHWAEVVGDAKRWYQGQYAKGAGYFFLGQMDSAKTYARLALERAIELDVPVDQVDAHNLLASILHHEGNIVLALDHFQQGLAICRALQDTVQIYTLLVNMADIYTQQGDLEQAQATYQESLSLILPHEGLAFAAAVVYNNLGDLETTPVDSAIRYLKVAQGIFTRAGYPDGQAHTHANLGKRYLEKGSINEAMTAFEAAIEIWSRPETNFKPGLIKSWSGLAQAYAQQTAFARARALSDRAIGLGEEFGLKPELENAYLDRARIEEAAGNTERALFYLKTGTALQKELLDEAKTKALSQARIRFETEQKERLLAQSELELAQGKLALSRQQNQNMLILTSGIGLLLLMGGGFVWWRNQQRLKQKETELALQLKEAEAHSLRELDALKSHFFANISHEFRTPLTLILTPLRQLIENKLPGPHDTYLQMMLRNGERLQQLIEQLLDLSRLEAGRMELQLIRGDIFQFLRTLAAQFESYAHSRQIRFHVHIPQSPLHTAFDPDKLEKTVTNLLSNAFKFTPEEGDVWLRAEVVEGELEIVVEDNGIGMEEEEVNQIFDRFYRQEAEGYTGAGIGLALVKELTDLAKGTVSVSSEPGQGSMFRVNLPLVSEAAAPEQTPAVSPVAGLPPSPAETAKGMVSDGDKAVLLIVEDNPDVRQLLQGILSSSYHVHLAENGQEGLEMARKLVPDLVISDIMMPRMDGYAFTQHLKADELTSHIPVIHLTAKASQAAKIEGLDLGADDYIAKPFDHKELELKLRNLLQQRERIRKKFGKDVVRLGPAELEVTPADQRFLQRVIDVAEQFLHDETFSVEDMGREVGLSRSQLHRKLKALTDQSPSVFLRSLRLQRARQLLEQRAGTAAEIAYQTGFSSPAYFSKCYKDEYGHSPSESLSG
ncbi:MAG: response regulator [Bacteroidetes bacterium]|nr:MAG: response regulator [Bacteroidota bacterium]